MARREQRSSLRPGLPLHALNPDDKLLAGLETWLIHLRSRAPEWLASPTWRIGRHGCAHRLDHPAEGGRASLERLAGACLEPSGLAIGTRRRIQVWMPVASAITGCWKVRSSGSLMRSTSSSNDTVTGLGAPQEAVKAIVLFRTHFWDAFVDRQFSRLLQASTGLDVFVLTDDTRSPVPVPSGIKRFSVSDDMMLRAGFVAAGSGSMQWFSGDVPLYLFAEAYPDYTSYIQLEYDVVINTELRTLAERLHHDKVDLLLLSNEELDKPWPWQYSMLSAYNAFEVRHQLFCFGVFSSVAIRRLHNARSLQALAYHNGDLTEWPYCEGYIATEGRRQGLCIKELSEYLSVPNYKWWPPYLETDGRVNLLGDIVHPVLDKPRFLASLLKHDISVKSLAWPFSWFNRKLMQLGPSGLLRVLASRAYRERVRTTARSRISRLTKQTQT